MWRHAGWFILAVALAGCGGSGKIEVKGRVIFDGKPVETGSISFDPADGQGPSSGGEIKDGNYELRGEAGLTPGKKIVRIRASGKTGRQVEAGPPAPPGTFVDEVKAYIPLVYNEKSTLHVDIAPGKSNEHDFDLTSAK